MRVDQGEIEKQSRDRAKASTDALLERLIEHHSEKPIEPEPEQPKPPRSSHWFSMEREITPLRIDDIMRAVCIYFKISKIALISERRTSRDVYPRQIGYYLCKKHTTKSLPEIGRKFGKDHTTALHGVNKIEQRRAGNAALNRDILLIEEALYA